MINLESKLNYSVSSLLSLTLSHYIMIVYEIKQNSIYSMVKLSISNFERSPLNIFSTTPLGVKPSTP